MDDRHSFYVTFWLRFTKESFLRTPETFHRPAAHTKPWDLLEYFCICLKLLKDSSCTKSSIFKFEQIFWHMVVVFFFFPDSFSPEQRIPQTPQTCVCMLLCDSSIWTHPTDFLMIREQDFLSRSQTPFPECWPVSLFIQAFQSGIFLLWYLQMWWRGWPIYISSVWSSTLKCSWQDI